VKNLNSIIAIRVLPLLVISICALAGVMNYRIFAFFTVVLFVEFIIQRYLYLRRSKKDKEQLMLLLKANER
jgi:hypothetical protein